MNTLQSRKSVMIFVLSFTIAFGCFLNLPAVAQTNEKVAKEVIAIAKAQWAAQSSRQPASVWMKNIADEYTEFNPDSPTRLDGKALNGRLGDALGSGSGEFVVDEMVNEKVQVYGDVASSPFIPHNLSPLQTFRKKFLSWVTQQSLKDK